MTGSWLGRAVCAGVVVAIVAAGSGCASFSTMHTATPIEKGKGEIGGGLGAVVLSGDIPVDALPVSGDQQAITLPTLELGMRYGIAENVGIGFKVFPVGAGADLNYAAVNTDDIAISFNPTVSVASALIGTWGNATMNILVDVLKTEDWTVTVGAKQGYFFISSANRISSEFFLAGATALVEWRVSDTVRIRPGATVLYPSPNNEVNALFSEGLVTLAWEF